MGRPLLQVHVVVDILLDSLLIVDAGKLHNCHNILILLIINEYKSSLLAINKIIIKTLTRQQQER